MSLKLLTLFNRRKGLKPPFNLTHAVALLAVATGEAGAGGTKALVADPTSKQMLGPPADLLMYLMKTELKESKSKSGPPLERDYPRSPPPPRVAQTN